MGRNTKKMILGVCLGIAVLISVPAPSWADAASNPVNACQLEEISPCMMYIERWSNTLTISGQTATIKSWVEGNEVNATKAKVTAELQVKSGSNWISVKGWSETVYGSRASVNETWAVTSGNTFRVKATITVWNGTLSESMTVYSSERTA